MEFIKAFAPILISTAALLVAALSYRNARRIDGRVVRQALIKDASELEDRIARSRSEMDLWLYGYRNTLRDYGFTPEEQEFANAVHAPRAKQLDAILARITAIRVTAHSVKSDQFIGNFQTLSEERRKLSIAEEENKVIAQSMSIAELRERAVREGRTYKPWDIPLKR